MSLPMFLACVDGYKERMFDLETLAVKQGYWAAYYQGKHPKSPASIIQSMINNHERDKKRGISGPAVTTNSDVTTFQEREARLMAASVKRK